jgi:tetratricopeptide (TPR) repeat protein
VGEHCRDAADILSAGRHHRAMPRSYRVEAAWRRAFGGVGPRPFPVFLFPSFPAGCGRQLDPKSRCAANGHTSWTVCGWKTAKRRRGLCRQRASANGILPLALITCIYRREYDEACAHLRKAIALNPNDVEARGIYAFYLTAIGEVEAALEQFDIAKRHNPFEFNWVIWYRGIALFTARRYDEAIAVLKQVHNPNNEVRFWLAANYAGAGRLPEARAALAEFLAEAEREMPDFPGRDLEPWKPYLHRAIEYRDPAEFDHLFGALQAAGLR